tara:strand:+ start:76 stop:1158 length:1083 start_codon:yes stop_codon:yes gene_type:complete
MVKPLSRSAILINLSERQKIKSRLILFVFFLFLVLITIPISQYFLNIYVPYNQTALRVEETIFTRKNVVDFVRFNQRLSEEQGVQFNAGSSLFESLQLIAENEISYLSATPFGLTVEQWEIDEAFFIRLGFYNDIDVNIDEDLQNFQERKIQFLNEVQLDEETYQNIVRKGIFREKLRRELSREIPLSQPHVLVYKIILDDIQPSVISEIERRINQGENLDDIARSFSIDKNVIRDKGNIGWTPKGINPVIDELFFNKSERLGIKKLSEPYINQEANAYELYVITDYSELKELSDDNELLLSENSLVSFLSTKSNEIDIEYGLDNDTFNWINSRVEIASILPDSGPVDDNIMGMNELDNQ